MTNGEPEGNVEASGHKNEVALRSPDGPGEDDNSFRKVFVCQGEGFDRDDHPSHNANKAHVLEEAIQRGLHPKGEPELTDAFVQSTNRRGVSTWEVVYEVEVVPASVDDAPPSDTVSPRAFIEGLGGTTNPDPAEDDEDA